MSVSMDLTGWMREVEVVTAAATCDKTVCNCTVAWMAAAVVIIIIHYMQRPSSGVEFLPVFANPLLLLIAQILILILLINAFKNECFMTICHTVILCTELYVVISLTQPLLKLSIDCCGIVGVSV